MLDSYLPVSEAELGAFIAEAAQRGMPVEVCGHGSKRTIGRPCQTAERISTSRLTGITLYQPSELVISAHAGTPLADIENLLAANRQMLAFEPADWGPLAEKRSAKPSIGSVFATNTSGARRILRGAARDHLLGIRAVNGRGETIKWGGRVMKNVTGIDLARGLSGSWGTLAVLSEVTMKVLPIPEEVRTLLLFGLPDEAAVAVMCAAMNTPYEVSGTVHLPANMAARLGNAELAGIGRAVTAIRLENFPASIAYRSDKLSGRLGSFGELYSLDHEASLQFWDDIRRHVHLAGSNTPLWRVTTAPSRAVEMVNTVASHLDCQAAYDWSGGLVWLEMSPSRDADATELRRLLADFGAHAMLVRAPLSVRSAVEVFQPLPAANLALTRQLKAVFDPAGILNPGRIYSEV
jgi:glycolate oxidase FAD binding subunit